VRNCSLALTSSALGCVVGFASAATAAPALPSGGHVVAGSASIGKSSGSTLTIDQSSSKAIINWSGFSIGQGGTVRFDNGSGATLNRVTGTNISSIDGLLSATGSVYLINPNGVIIGKSGVVDTGGTFIASTQDLTNASFMTGGTLTFSGTSTASVLNLGKVGSLGGDVALIASKIENNGTITASQGDVGLAAGFQVTMSDATQNDGKFQVRVGGSGTSATNTGTIQAAEAELKANGGNVYALAGNTGGTIQATGVSASDGKVLLIAENGTTTANGTLAGREVETSGASVNFAGVTVKAGAWLVDPTDLTISASAAASIDKSLAAGTSVTLKTTSSGASGPGVTSSGAGDIIIASGLSWSTSATLTLDSLAAITIDAPIKVGGAGGLVVDDDGDFSFGNGASINYGATSHGGAFTRNGVSYTLIYSLAQLAGLSGGSGDDALATSLNASSATYTAAVVASFGGTFEGLGNTISNLTIAASSGAEGLFGIFSGTLRDLGIVGGSVSGGEYDGDLVGHQSGGSIIQSYATGAVSGFAGGLVGYQSGGSIVQSYATGAVYGAIAGGLVGAQAGGGSIVRSYATGLADGGSAGGLVGVGAGDISQSYATGGALAGTDEAAGGLVGEQEGGAITQSYADGGVSGGGSAGGLVGTQHAGNITLSYATGAVGSPRDAGGLVGVSGPNGHIVQSYATGPVQGSGNVGGLVGSLGGSITASYWDTQTTGQSAGSGSGTGAFSATGLTTVQFAAASNFSGWTFGATPGASGWVIVDADGSLNNSGGAAGATRPMLLSEYSTTIVNGHQLELMNLDLSASYTLGADIDLEPEITDASGIWFVSSNAPLAGYGFVPVGGLTASFTGNFDGQGDKIKDMIIDRPKTDDVGLFGDIGTTGSVLDIGLIGGSVDGSHKVGDLAGAVYGTVADTFASGSVTGADYVGGLVGYQSTGTIDGSYATGPVNAPTDAGGLVGLQHAGSITDSYATGAVSGTTDVGGLVGDEFGSVGLSHATGAVSGAADGDDVGGLVGGQNGGALNQSYSTGDVSGDDYIGGLVGIQDAGSITNSYSTGSASGTRAVGGLVGRIHGSLSFSYAAGAVTGGAYVAGLVGYISSGSVASSYWDAQATGQSAGLGGGSGGPFSAKGLTTAQMQNYQTYGTTYAGWNFTSVWIPPPNPAADGGKGAYPQLEP